MQSLTGEQAAAGQQELAGKAALIASVGGQRGWADWTNPDHRARRLLSEFIGMAGLTFILPGGAAILVRYGGHALQPWQTVLVLSAVSALWLVVAVYFLGDISAHFNPATTLSFAHDGRAVRGRLDEPGPELRAGCGHRQPVHLVGLPDRAGGRCGDRGRGRAGAARAGPGPGSQRGPGYPAGPDRMRWCGWRGWRGKGQARSEILGMVQGLTRDT